MTTSFSSELSGLSGTLGVSGVVPGVLGVVPGELGVVSGVLGAVSWVSFVLGVVDVSCVVVFSVVVFFLTVTLQVYFFFLTLAVIVVLPAFFAFTFPPLLTVAIFFLLDDHLIPLTFFFPVLTVRTFDYSTVNGNFFTEIFVFAAALTP